MARPIGAAVLSLIACVLIAVAFSLGGPATAVPAREPSLAWISGKKAPPEKRMAGIDRAIAAIFAKYPHRAAP